MLKQGKIMMRYKGSLGKLTTPNNNNKMSLYYVNVINNNSAMN